MPEWLNGWQREWGSGWRFTKVAKEEIIHQQAFKRIEQFSNKEL